MSFAKCRGSMTDRDKTPWLIPSDDITMHDAFALPALELETRVELTENHHVFSRLGFTIVGAGSHEGYDRPTDFLLRKPISLSEDS